MKITQIILEYSREVTAQKLGAALLQKFRKEPQQWQNRVTGAVTDYDDHALQYLLELVEKADPTKNKQYVPWIIRNYINSPSLKFEDAISKVSEPLKKFYKLVLKKQIPAPNNDIGRIKDLASLVQVVDQYPDVEDVQQDRGEAKEVYKDADLRIIKPADQTAACYYGQGTRWCTAAQNNNMFDTYAKKGELYIIIPTKPAHTGEKYQFHFETKQFMDEKDHRANLSELRQRYPQLADIFAKQAMEHNVLALRKDIGDLNVMMQKALPVFQQELKSSIARESKERAREIFVELGRTNRVFKNMEEIWELAEDMFDEKGGDLALMATNILRDDPDMASDEDQLFDALSNEITDIVRDTELWSYITELLEDLDDTESEFDAAMTIEGELNSMLQRLIPVAFAEAINAAKEQTKQGIEK